MPVAIFLWINNNTAIHFNKESPDNDLTYQGIFYFQHHYFTTYMLILTVHSIFPAICSIILDIKVFFSDLAEKSSRN